LWHAGSRSAGEPAEQYFGERAEHNNNHHHHHDNNNEYDNHDHAAAPTA
jgi:hypothetical protein